MKDAKVMSYFFHSGLSGRLRRLAEERISLQKDSRQAGVTAKVGIAWGISYAGFNNENENGLCFAIKLPLKGR
jgi:hypothetical protein